MQLLIADSDSTLTCLFRSFFTRQGFDVETTNDGLQCLSSTLQHQPDILVMSYKLPWGGGDGVLARLREEFNHLPTGVILILEAESEDEVAHEFLWPVVGCLQKPFRLSELSKMINSSIDVTSSRNETHHESESLYLEPKI